LIKPIVYSHHALEQMPDRGVTNNEVEETIGAGERLPAKRGRWAFRRTFLFGGDWQGKPYLIKQVVPIVAEEADRIVVVTVYAFYLGS
jgi:hypothetical protein